MTRSILLVVAWSLVGYDATPPAPPPEPDHLAEDIAKLNAELLACMQRENARLQQERDDLDAKIRVALEEAAVLASEAQRNPRKASAPHVDRP